MKKGRSNSGRDDRLHPDIVLFEQLTGAVVDSSSLILMEKAGFLRLLSDTLVLYTIPEVLEETGKPGFEDRVKIISVQDTFTPERRHTDRRVVQAAVGSGLPVLAEDKKILLEADREGIRYFNALMMLNFLLWKGAVDLSSFEGFREKLFREARYSPRILEYAQELYFEILKNS